MLTTWRSIAEDPSWVLKERKRLGLLPDLPAELEQELLPYYEQAAEGELFTQDCGGAEAARADFEFYKYADQIKGDPSTLKVEDFWYLDPIAPALQNAKAEGS